MHAYSKDRHAYSFALLPEQYLRYFSINKHHRRFDYQKQAYRYYQSLSRDARADLECADERHLV